VTAHLPHRLLDTALRLKARDYARGLYVGATVDANDKRYLDGTNWGKFLDEALAEQGLVLVGETVRRMEER